MNQDHRRGPDPDRILAAQLTGTARQHPRWRELAQDEQDAAVTELRELVDGRADVLAQLAEIFEDTFDGELDEQLAGQAAHLCRLAGADETLIPHGLRRDAAAGPPSPTCGRTRTAEELSFTSTGLMTRPVLRAAAVQGQVPGAMGGRLRLAGTEPGGGDIGPGMAVRACRAYRGRGGEREGGMDLRGSQGQRPFLLVGDALVRRSAKGQQALGLGITFRARHRSSRWLSILYEGDSQSHPGRCAQGHHNARRGLSLLPGFGECYYDRRRHRRSFTATESLTLKSQRLTAKCSSKMQQPFRTTPTPCDRQCPVNCTNDRYRSRCT
jgi:hypothetical protein